jgi:L-iditol 2-dehydrogenase
MKVAMYYNNNDVRLEEMPLPKVGPGELLVEVIASGICGSDVMEWYRLKKAPLVLGHETAGEIVEVGDGVRGYKIGQRVFVSHHVPCNSCRFCQSGNHTACETLHATNYFPGGFSEYIRVPEINVKEGVFLLPDEISFEEGTFIEPLACVLRGQRIAGLKPQDSLLILGAGISGLLHLVSARAMGAKQVFLTDINKYRLDKAKKLGAAFCFEAQDDIEGRLRQFNQGNLADLVIVCTGALSAFRQSLKLVERSGTILFFAPTDPDVELPIPVNDFWRKGIKIMHSYGASPEDLAQAIEMLRKKKINVDELITHQLSLKETGLGFKLVAEAKECIKVIIKPHN